MRLMLVLSFSLFYAQNRPLIRIGKLQYTGGDWYGNRTALSNLLQYAAEHAPMPLALQEEVVSPSDPNLARFTLLYAAGHGYITFSAPEAQNLRTYLLGGGLLLLDDDYGFFPYAQEALRQIFPEGQLKPLPANHPLFSCYYQFPYGLPKVHEHDNKPPQLYGFFYGDKLVALLTHEADLGDGWENPEIHKDPPHVRELAFQMGVNILCYAATLH
jgi:hypothetical protein